MCRIRTHKKKNGVQSAPHVVCKVHSTPPLPTTFRLGDKTCIFLELSVTRDILNLDSGQRVGGIYSSTCQGRKFSGIPLAGKGDP